MLGLFQRAVEQSASAFILVDRDGTAVGAADSGEPAAPALPG